jgi:uncharacterized pyridoxal phosphate-dependent enzyme
MGTEFLAKRRAFMKWAAALPLLTQINIQEAFGEGWGGVEKTAKENIYTRLGVKTLINARGTWTYISGSLELPEVRAAQEEAAKHFVNMFELQHAVGKRLAELSGAEFGMITAGAAASIASATAACIAGSDPERIWQLPDTTGLKHEVVMLGGRISFDNAIRMVGGKLVVIENSPELLQNAINENSAMIYTQSAPRSPDQLKVFTQCLAIAKAAKVPLLLDSAAGIPPMENLRKWLALGCDLVDFSGGKGLCGPQSSGLLLGRKDLIEAAMYNSSPWEGAICRPMKVGKEEIMGCLAAVETWLKTDEPAVNRERLARAQRIAKLVETVPGVTTDAAKITRPSLTISWDQQGWGFTVADCAQKLLDGTPAISVTAAGNPSDVLSRNGPPKPGSVEMLWPAGFGGAANPHPQLRIDTTQLQPGEEIIVGRRLREVLSAARKAS